MQNSKNTFFRIPKLGKMLLLASGFLTIGSALLLGNNQATATLGSNTNTSEGQITFRDINAQYLSKHFSKTHFTLSGNNFGGGVIWLPTEELSAPQSLQINGQSYNCTTKIRGYYYNSQRGERLWPLDEKTREEMNYKQKVEGGRYTNCKEHGTNKPADPYGIYGSIKHVDGLGSTYVLNAGIMLDTEKNKMKDPGGFQCNLQRLNNQFPFGYFFDNAGGIGLLGASVNTIGEATTFHNNLLGKLKNNKCLVDLYSFDGNKPTAENNELINNLDFGNGTAEATIFKLGIRGIVGVSNENKTNGKEGNESQTSVTVKTDNSISQILNITKKNAEHICKGKWLKHTPSQNEKIRCLDAEDSVNKTIQSNTNNLAGKTIIVKNGNLELTSYLTDKKQAPTTIYLMKGNLILPANSSNLTTFLPNGYLDNNDDKNDDKNNPKAAFLKGNFIINGLIAIKGDQKATKLSNKLVIHGKVASLNTLETPSKDQEDFIKGVAGKGKPIILSELFGRSCNPNTGKGSDGTPCNSEGFITDKAFSLIDMNFPSPLFQ